MHAKSLPNQDNDPIKDSISIGFYTMTKSWTEISTGSCNSNFFLARKILPNPDKELIEVSISMDSSKKKDFQRAEHARTINMF